MATQAAGSQAADYTKSGGMTSFNGGSKRRGTLQRKFRLCIPFLGVARPHRSLDFHIHVSVSYLYITRISPHIFGRMNYKDTEPYISAFL